MSDFDPEPLLRELTQRPGVYCMHSADGKLIYVGKARNLKRRVSSYFRGRAHDSKTIALLENIASINVTVTRTEAEALMLEYNLIKQHHPRFNVMLRDDKSYPYIRMDTSHAFPRISFYRGSRKIKGRLFGPYPSAGAVRSTIGELQKLFRVRGCEDSYYSNRSRPCLQHQIGRCTAPCVGLIEPEEYQQDVNDAMLFLEGRSEAVAKSLTQRMDQAAASLNYELAAKCRDQLAELTRINSDQLVARSSGNFDVVAGVMEHGVACISVMFFRGGRSLGNRNFFPQQTRNAELPEIMRAFVLQYYAEREAPPEILLSTEIEESEDLEAFLGEKANRRVAINWRLRGDRKRLIEMGLTNASHGAALRSRSSASLQRQYHALAEALKMEEPPARLECYDISHTQGQETTASCVVFGLEGPIKSDYRRFNIRLAAPGDDYAAMEEVLRRRLQRVARGDAPRPDVIIVDGGTGQMERAALVLREVDCTDIVLLGVAKGAGRKSGRETIYYNGQRLNVDSHSPALHLIQQLRDEAHRFAIMGHRAKRQKRQTQSPLEGIEGLGPKRRRDLLKQFGGLQALQRAGVEELARVRGISRQLAQRIYERFHNL